MHVHGTKDCQAAGGARAEGRERPDVWGVAFSEVNNGSTVSMKTMSALTVKSTDWAILLKLQMWQVSAQARSWPS